MVPVYTKPEEFLNRGLTLKTHQMPVFRTHYTGGIKNAVMIGQFSLVFD